MKIFDPLKPCTTRSGSKARVICTDRDGDRSVVALVKHPENSEETATCYHKDGRFYSHTDCVVDLVNVPERTSTWQNVYCDASGQVCPSKEKADYSVSKMRASIGYLRRDFEDGVFVGVEFVPLDKE